MKKILMSLMILLLTGNLALAQEKLPQQASPERSRRAQKNPEYLLKLCAIAPEGTSWSNIAHQFADYIYEKSGGRLKVVWYLGGTMGDEPITLKKIRLAQLQGGVFTIVGMAKIVPEIRVLALPYLFKNYDEVDYVLGKMASAFSGMFDAKGFQLLGWVEVGFAYFFSKKPILTLDDIRETKVWYWAGDPLQQDVFELQGFKNTVPLELFEVLPALQTGLIETFFAPYYGCLALQWYPYAKYVNTAPIAYTPGGVLVTKSFLNGLPQDLRKILDDASKKYFPKLIPIIRRDNEQALQGFIKKGIKVLTPTPEIEEQNEREAWEFYEKLEDKYYPWLLGGIMNARARFRAIRAE
jgi:TRAP-type C4-dicarboxylate transport system substrate-binding protein